MSPASPAAYLEVDLDALRANYRALCAAAPRATCAGVVKADAYGLGLAP
ncbi:MAG: alanine racemase, partial [Pseudomonadota bacterium]|nr:alanine racemase [Pseudomonadota bacterium]